MPLLDMLHEARRDELVARLRRALALRALVASGMSQRQIADELGVSQPAVSQQLRLVKELDSAAPDLLLEAAAPIVRALAEERGYRELAVFGSVARGESRADSDIDLLVEPPDGVSSFDLVAFQQLLNGVLGREVDLATYGGLQPGVDDDIRRDAVLL